MITPALVMALALGIASASEQTDNLLKNPSFVPASSNQPGRIEAWSLVPLTGWERQSRLISPAAPYETVYLERKCSGRAELNQGPLTLESNTWYVLTALYKASLSPAPVSGNLWLGRASLKDNQDFGYTGDQITMGSAGQWLRARCYFNSGTNIVSGIQARFFGQGTCAIGELELRKVRNTDFEGELLLDGDFEHGIAGCVPADFIGSKQYVPTVTADGNPVSGKQALKVMGTESGALQLPSAQRILARPGTRIQASFRARTDKPGLVLMSALVRTAPAGEFWREQNGVTLTEEWREYRMEAVVPAKGSNGYQEGCQLIALVFGSQMPAATTIWLDSIRVKYAPAESAETGRRSTGNRNRVWNSSFESGKSWWISWFPLYVLDNIPETQPGSAMIDMTTAAEGTCSLRMDVPVIPPVLKNHPSRWTTGMLVSDPFPAVDGEELTVSFWMKTEVAGQLGVYLTPQAWLHGENITLNPGPTWRRYSLKVAPKSVPGYPVNDRLRLLFQFSKPGVYGLDAVQVETGDLTDYMPPGKLEIGADMARVYPAFASGETPEARVYLCSRLDRDAKLDLRVTVKDWRDCVVAEEQKRVNVPAGKTIMQTMPLFAEAKGRFMVELQLQDPKSGVTAVNPLFYGIFPPARELASAEESSFGSHQLILPQGQIIVHGGNLDDIFSLMRLAGIRWDRTWGLGAWALHEPERGRWQWMDRYVNTALRHGVKLMPIMGESVGPFNGAGMPKWAWSDRLCSNQYLKGDCYPKQEHWINFIAAYVRHYGDRIDALEMFNETGCCESAPYVEYVRAARQALKQVNPQVRVVAPAYPCQQVPYGPEDDTWVGQVLKMGLYEDIDVYSAHFYGSRPYNGKYLEDFVDLYGTLEQSLTRRMMYLRKAYGNKPVWDTEFSTLGGLDGRLKWAGWQNDLPSADAPYANQRAQAERTVRWTVMKKALGIERFFYHVLLDTSLTCGNTLLETSGTPKPVTVAYAQMARRLDTAKFVRKINLTETTWAYLFEPADKQPFVIYWDYAAIESDRESSLTLSVSKRDIDAEDLMGNAIPLETKRGCVALPLGTSPVYVMSRNPEKLSALDLLARFEKAKIAGVAPCQVTVALGAPDHKPALILGMRNLIFDPVSGKVQITRLPYGWRAAKDSVMFRDVARDGEQSMAVPLTQFERNPQGEAIVLNAEVAETPVEFTRKLWLCRAPKTKTPITVDGTIAEIEYGAAQPIEINAQEQVLSHVRWTSWGGAKDGSLKARVVWDEKAVYIGMEITDDMVTNTAPDSALYDGDSVEVYLNTAPDRNIFKNTWHSHQGRANCAPAAPPQTCARLGWKVKAKDSLIDYIDEGHAQVASKKTDTGYTIELKIPVRDITLTAGSIWGFDISLIDIDPVSGGKRTQLAWASKEPWARPLEFGSLLLTP